MSPSAHVVPIVDSTSVFKPDIFKGKVLFCTGGGSGICRGMTEAMVSSSIFCSGGVSQELYLFTQMRHGANAAIVGRKYVRRHRWTSICMLIFSEFKT